MSVEALRTLAIATVASSIAILLVVLLRKPLRALAGARAAYWLWLSVPVLTAASCIPAPEQIIFQSRFTLPREFASALPALGPMATEPTESRILISTALSIWLVGACVMFARVLRKQRTFSRSLGPLTIGPGGLHRSQSAAGPMLLGIWRPIIVVPPDFEVRYSEQERQLVLAHELAHFRRHDALSNAIATGWLCVFWFNPLVYWAIDWLRADQELACDALVIANNAHAKRSYANALLKFQLDFDSDRRIPKHTRCSQLQPSTWCIPANCRMDSPVALPPAPRFYRVSADQIPSWTQEGHEVFQYRPPARCCWNAPCETTERLWQLPH